MKTIIKEIKPDATYGRMLEIGDNWSGRLKFLHKLVRRVFPINFVYELWYLTQVQPLSKKHFFVVISTPRTRIQQPVGMLKHTRYDSDRCMTLLGRFRVNEDKNNLTYGG